MFLYYYLNTICNVFMSSSDLLIYLVLQSFDSRVPDEVYSGKAILFRQILYLSMTC